MLIPDHILQQARTLARIGRVTQSIFRLESGTHVIAPEGYDIPNVTVKLVGKVDRNGKLTDTDDTESDSSAVTE